MQGTNLKIMLD